MMTAFTPDFAYFVPGQDAFAGGNGIQDSKKSDIRAASDKVFRWRQ